MGKEACLFSQPASPSILHPTNKHPRKEGKTKEKPANSCAQPYCLVLSSTRFHLAILPPSFLCPLVHRSVWLCEPWLSAHLALSLVPNPSVAPSFSTPAVCPVSLPSLASSCPCPFLSPASFLFLSRIAALFGFVSLFLFLPFFLFLLPLTDVFFLFCLFFKIKTDKIV